jgi:hypothetical protein
MISNNINLFVGYGLAAVLYIGYAVSLHVRRRNLQAAIAAQTDLQN